MTMDSDQQAKEWCQKAALGDRDAAGELLRHFHVPIFAYLESWPCMNPLPNATRAGRTSWSRDPDPQSEQSDGNFISLPQWLWVIIPP
jgi:hypothetical protein